MLNKVTPMIHVPDVRATADWYVSLGFGLKGANEEDSELNWAHLSLADTDVMFSSGGRPSDASRREVDLYLAVHDIDELYERIHDRVEVVEALHDTFYGMREFIIRDPNRFWLTFGQPLVT
jgi:uncharacterized glyoxalase superfamily protein PhnB